MTTRRIFQAYLSRGYRVVDFFLSREARRGHYLLAVAETQNSELRTQN
jgi:predicted GNAT superfamily acetyltransferase